MQSRIGSIILHQIALEVLLATRFPIQVDAAQALFAVNLLDKKTLISACLVDAALAHPCRQRARRVGFGCHSYSVLLRGRGVLAVVVSVS